MRLFGNRLKPVLYLCGALLVALPVLIALPQHAAPQPAAGSLVFTVDPAQSSLHWTLGSSLHTVHGTFALKRGSLQVDPATGKASGEIVVDATSGKSGNDGRDRKMHKEVLESGQFGEIIFRPDNISGKLEPQGDSTIQIHGVFVLHGSEHELTVPVQATESQHLVTQGRPLHLHRLGAERHGSNASGAVSRSDSCNSSSAKKRTLKVRENSHFLFFAAAESSQISGAENAASS